MADKVPGTSSFGRILKPSARSISGASGPSKKAPPKTSSRKKPTKSKKTTTATPKRTKGGPKSANHSPHDGHGKCNVAQLKALLKARGISTTGMDKAHLVQAATISDNTPVTSADHKKLTVKELEGLLDCLGINRSSQRKKDALIRLLLGANQRPPRGASEPAHNRPSNPGARAGIDPPEAAPSRVLGPDEPAPDRPPRPPGWGPYRSLRSTPTTAAPPIPTTPPPPPLPGRRRPRLSAEEREILEQRRAEEIITYKLSHPDITEDKEVPIGDDGFPIETEERFHTLSPDAGNDDADLFGDGDEDEDSVS